MALSSEFQNVEPITREDFLKYAQDITLDPNTARSNLYLSDGNRRVEEKDERQELPDHPDRFINNQVMSCEELTDRCYWEVEWSGKYGVLIAASYRDIDRDSEFGETDKSWALLREDCGYEFYFNHNETIRETKVSGPMSSRIGVYLDHAAGVLSFYSVQDQTMTLLHRVNNRFTRPLHAGVWVSYGGNAYFPKLK